MPTSFVVSGRGELHLTILLENMRREGYELAVSRAARGDQGDRRREVRAVRTAHAWTSKRRIRARVMEALGRRRGDLQDMESDGKGRVRLEYRIPARGLIGFQGEFLTLTRGTGIDEPRLRRLRPGQGRHGRAPQRRADLGRDDGEAVAYALWKLQERGRMFVSRPASRSTKA